MLFFPCIVIFLKYVMRNKGEATLWLVKDALIEENKERLNAHVEV